MARLQTARPTTPLTPPVPTPVDRPDRMMAAPGSKTPARGKDPFAHDEIAARAYELFLARGAGDGQDLDDWLEAERLVMGESGAMRHSVDGIQ